MKHRLLSAGKTSGRSRSTASWCSRSNRRWRRPIAPRGWRMRARASSRSAAGGRFRPRLRPGGRRALDLLRLAEPRQGEPGRGHQAADGRGPPARDPRPRGRVHPEPGAGRGGAGGLRIGGAAAALPAARHGRHLGLRRRPCLYRDEGLRPPGAGRERPRLHYGASGRAGAGPGSRPATSPAGCRPTRPC